MKNLFSIYIRKKMEEVGVIAEYENSSLTCKCADCGYVWFPLLKTGGKFYRNFWRCINGCNKK